MSRGSIRRRRTLSVLSFLFVLAVCAAFAAHARLHDLELAEAGHPSGHHEVVPHDHPGIAPAGPTMSTLLEAVGVLVTEPAAALLPGRPLIAQRLRPGPPLCDGDVGLYDVLSVYRI
ncbi:MAG: hypothetical protein NDJ92_20490 [Thermoanaerobaculia bacterium]|nr:hypothetical protein [Thermoanaerobaculia bacterium]